MRCPMVTKPLPHPVTREQTARLTEPTIYNSTDLKSNRRPLQSVFLQVGWRGSSGHSVKDTFLVFSVARDGEKRKSYSTPSQARSRHARCFPHLPSYPPIVGAVINALQSVAKLAVFHSEITFQALPLRVLCRVKGVGVFGNPISRRRAETIW